ncbi:hypothetical protein GCM10010195_66670 [Kitasatospora griseola]|nr:hypothetical protein GCM10010195_66670 [Kitasatospora griseola]
MRGEHAHQAAEVDLRGAEILRLLGRGKFDATSVGAGSGGKTISHEASVCQYDNQATTVFGFPIFCRYSVNFGPPHG